MRILSWNILHGGGAVRLPEIILSLLRHKPDVVLLTEFRTTRGSQIRAALADHGLPHQLTSHPQRADPCNGMLMASRLPLEAARAPAEFGGRWLEARFSALGLHVLGVHVPDDTRPTDKAAYWQAIVRLGRARLSEHCLILGDFNTGRRHQDGPAAGARRASIHGCEALLGTLLSLGYVDGWRHLNAAAREFSWVSAAGDERRIDTAYLSPPLASSLQTAAYSHFERQQSFSDHAPLLLELDDSVLTRGRAAGNLAPSQRPGLFAPDSSPPGAVPSIS
jgi:exonuclease III